MPLESVTVARMTEGPSRLLESAPDQPDKSRHEYADWHASGPERFKWKNSRAIHLMINYRWNKNQINPNEEVARLAKSEWGTSPFDREFRSLDDASEFRQVLSLGDLRRSLEKDLKQAGDSIELFGVTIPGSYLQFWSMTALAVTMSYFYLHLSEFRRRAEIDDSVWNAVWIGLYPGSLARNSFCASTGILPLFVCVMVIFRIGLPNSWASGLSVALTVPVLALSYFLNRVMREIRDLPRPSM